MSLECEDVSGMQTGLRDANMRPECEQAFRIVNDKFLQSEEKMNEFLRTINKINISYIIFSLYLISIYI